MKKETKIYMALTAYVLAGVVVFGHAVNNIKATTAPSGHVEFEVKAIKVFLSGTLWPLYLSVKLWEEQPKGAEAG